jgi:hypothetical protein
MTTEDCLNEVERLMREEPLDVCEIHFWQPGTSYNGETGEPFAVTITLRNAGQMTVDGETLADAWAKANEYRRLASGTRPGVR